MGERDIVIGICDDNPEDVNRIQQEIYKCVNLLGEKAPIIIICESGRELLENCKRQITDLVFVDLEMPEWNGFELAEQLYALAPTIKIIFVSNHENMVFDSYEYAPLWFVRKSSMERDMLKAIRRYFQMEAKVQIRCKDGDEARELWVNLDEVLYIECSGHTLFVYMKNKECHKSYGSLKPLEEKLFAYGFVRIHKNYLVNAKCVREIGNRAVCLWNGIELDIGKNRRKEIKQLLESFQHGRRMC